MLVVDVAPLQACNKVARSARPHRPPSTSSHVSSSLRSQRYKLNKVMASRRKLKPAPRRETSVHDRLMADIRQPQRLRPVRKRGSAGTSGRRRSAKASVFSKFKHPKRAFLAVARRLRRVMGAPRPIRAVVSAMSGMGRFRGFWKHCRNVSRAGYRRIPVLTVWPIFQRWSDQRPLAQWRKSRAECGGLGGISDVVDGPPSSPPPLAPQREQLKRGAAVVRRTGKRPVHPWSLEDDTSQLSLDMKELGAESDEDVGLGLDLDDEEEFLKCIEDDCAGEPQDHKIASQPQKPLETSRTNLVESTKTQQPRRRLIRADIALHLSSSHDEGIEKDSGEDDSGGGDGGDGPGKTPHRAGLTLAKVLEMCASHLQDPAQADLHYKAVCRALVAEAVELSTFLQKISSGTKEFIKCHHSDPDTSDIDGLQFQDWAMLWMQVIRELRQGVKLRKVDNLDWPNEHFMDCRSCTQHLSPSFFFSYAFKSRKALGGEPCSAIITIIIFSITAPRLSRSWRELELRENENELLAWRFGRW
ncbi:hypothetical protein HPB51_026876 [Rhipicephalus microplus]|uniref:KIND domain-containing protein n=1 Tax=Rhipicephalus microplus TaxID=6941 RepID=A0A9J6D1R9_RHIMP|nr:hypothetical protein HPB51_026876 [Rhipicephalus microplus]